MLVIGPHAQACTQSTTMVGSSSRMPQNLRERIASFHFGERELAGNDCGRRLSRLWPAV